MITSIPVRFLRPLLLLPAVGTAIAQPDTEATHTQSPYFVVAGAAPGIDALPLQSTRADVTVTQIYRNEGATPIEARHA